MRGSNKESPSSTAVIIQPSIRRAFIPCLFCHAKHFQTCEFAENQCCLPRSSYKHLKELSSSFGVNHEGNRTRLPKLWGSVWLPDSWSWARDHYPRPHVKALWDQGTESQHHSPGCSTLSTAFRTMHFLPHPIWSYFQDLWVSVLCNPSQSWRHA